MPPSLKRVTYISALSLTGGLMGLGYAQQQLILTITARRERWGMVCGVGLDFPLYFWTAAGALTGFVAATFTWQLYAWKLRRADQNKNVDAPAKID